MSDEVDWTKVRRALADEDYDWSQLSCAELREAQAFTDEAEERWFATEPRIAKWRIRDDEDAFGLEIVLDPKRAITLTIPKPGGMYDGEPNHVTVWTGNGEHDFDEGESVESFREWLDGVGKSWP